MQLFPSLKASESGKVVRGATISIIEETDFNVEGLDYKEMAKYIRMNLSDKEISERNLMRLMPVRKFRKGRMPGMTGSAALKKTDEDEKFIYSNVELSKGEKTNIFATCLEIAVSFMFKNHVYSFGGENYLQTDSGPIGLRITMAVARLVMGEWGQRMRNILNEADIKIFLEGIYVDDARYVTSRVPDGVRWSHGENKFIFQEEWRKEDSSSSADHRKKKTSNELCKAMNSIFPNIKFTIENEEDFENKRLPTLDFDLWMDENFLKYSFYEKPMKTPFCIMKSSAMSEKSKIQILSQDLIRRMLNICDTVPQSERNKIVNDYTDRLTRSGYSLSQAKEIVVSGLTGYEKKVARAARTNVPLHRPASSTLKTRLHKKLTQRQNWFKEKKKKEESVSKKAKSVSVSTSVPPIVSVMFVQQTPKSQLLQQLRATELKISAVTGDRVKLVERSGTKLRHLLVSSDPWSNSKCSDKKCLVCSNPLNTNFSCRKRNICYKTYCLKCAKEAGLDEKSIKSNLNDNIKFYFGETHRDANTRGNEHLFDYNSQSEDSHMMKHLCEDHKDSSQKDIRFGMSVVKKHKSSFERQIFESILIFRGGKNVLNSKSEYSRCVVPRLSTMISDNGQIEDSHLKVIHEKKKLNKRKKLIFDEANVCPNPPKRRKFDDSETDAHVETETDDLEIEETSPKHPAPDENINSLKVLPSFKKFKKPTKNKTKKSKTIEGQQTITNFFTKTKGENSPTSTAPT